ncbi:hypothetical protein RO3G_07897 [Lichtheimia corymbifera JMRC:FSU:9682]|uniref:Large ribosomal subunit protein mL50 n=1 Tax=Lichtheimia corymbifera JMRC:FSU:9682 TaxID=1263082 RepID=A0A068SEC2_9FUNG|nr:hypothetical protein RO3G_07897 [Lichtheimia corymbifera JMRC:FSU:9682]
MFACRRIVHLSRNLHTSTPVAAGGFSRFNPWAKKPESQEPATTTPVNNANADAPAAAFDVTYYDDEPDTLSWRNKEIIQDQDKVQSIVKSIVLESVNGSDENNWKATRLDAADVKFKVVKESIAQLGKEVSNLQLNNMQTVSDVLDHFLRKDDATKKSSVQQFFEDNADTLPSNLVFRSNK